MAIAAASSTNLAFTTTATPTINKPSGLAAGDLMVFFLLDLDAGSTSCTRTGWSAIDSFHDTNRDNYLYSLYKVADAGDAAASSFAFTLNGSHTCGAVMYRVTGYTGTIANFQSSQSGNSTNQTFTGFTPSYASLLMLFETADINGTASAQTVDSTAMTEAHDFTGSTRQISASSIRYAKGGTATGSFTCTLSGYGFGSATAVAVLESPVTGKDTLTLTESVKGSLGAIARDTIALVESVTNSILRAWSNLTKNAASWTNLNK